MRWRQTGSTDPCVLGCWGATHTNYRSCVQGVETCSGSGVVTPSRAQLPAEQLRCVRCWERELCLLQLKQLLKYRHNFSITRHATYMCIS